MAWSPPTLLRPAEPGHVRGALNGSLLYDRPEHAEARQAITDFLAEPGPVALEIGFDHGMVVLDQARRYPEQRWIGLEIRRRRVQAAAPHAPPNCLLVRADARTVLARLVPEGRLSLVYTLFPTPTDDPRHLLLTPAFAGALRRVLAPGGRFHLATDVAGMHAWARELFAGWAEAEPPARGPVLSRRERVCRRDDLPIHVSTWACPAR